MTEDARENDPKKAPARRKYRLKPRKVGFGFDIADAKRLDREICDQILLDKFRRQASGGDPDTRSED